MPREGVERKAAAGRAAIHEQAHVGKGRRCRGRGPPQGRRGKADGYQLVRKHAELYHWKPVFLDVSWPILSLMYYFWCTRAVSRGRQTADGRKLVTNGAINYMVRDRSFCRTVNI